MRQIAARSRRAPGTRTRQRRSNLTGSRLFYEVYGAGEPTVLLMPTWEIVHSRCWKFQIPYLARHGRVVTFDPRGNGRSDRPSGYDAYRRREFAADALAVLNAAGIDRAIVVNWCDMGESLIFAARAPPSGSQAWSSSPRRCRTANRCRGSIHSMPSSTRTRAGPRRRGAVGCVTGPGYVEFFFAMCLTEPHSTKPIGDCVGWAMDIDMETILAGFRGWETKIIGPAEVAELGKRVRCPQVLVVHGTDDAQVDYWRGEELARQLNGQLVLLEGSGHAPHVRDPVKVQFACCGILRSRLHHVGGRGGVASAPSIFLPPLGWGMCSAMWRLRMSCAKCILRLRLIGLRSTPGDYRLCRHAGREQLHPASALIGQRIGPYRV